MSKNDKENKVLDNKDLEIKINGWLKKYWKDLITDDIFFFEDFKTRNDGIYVFEKKSKYHYLVVERGKIYKDDIVENFDDLKWRVLNHYVVIESMLYAEKRQKGGDFRKIWFQRELEICKMFGEEFYLRKKKEIDEILSKHPYTD